MSWIEQCSLNILSISYHNVNVLLTLNHFDIINFLGLEPMVFLMCLIVIVHFF